MARRSRVRRSTDRGVAVAGDGTITWRCVRATPSIASRRRGTIHHLAGTGAQGYTGDGGPARLATLGGPKGLAISGRGLYVVDTENHAIRRIDLDAGIITTVLGTGTRGDGPDGDPRRCALARPHGVCAGPDGVLYIGDSEAHRIRVLAGGSPGPRPRPPSSSTPSSCAITGRVIAGSPGG